ncbi:MAG: hypothetical protein ACE37D_09995, partial [Pseudomonadales bacterium]
AISRIRDWQMLRHTRAPLVESNVFNEEVEGNLYWFKKILEQRLGEGINHYSSSIQLYVFQSHWHNLYL